jgi:hypothetical protein
MADLIQLRGGDSAHWSLANPVLMSREVGIETDTNRMKIGDGVTNWNDLPYPATSNHTHLTFIFNQDTPSNVWNINHGQNKFPSVTIVDSSGRVVIGQITYVDLNNVQLDFNEGFSGKAYLN